MALFFDQSWFDQRLADVGCSQADVASLLRLSHEQVHEIWKDQRELLPHEVGALSKLLQKPAAEVAEHAGVSTPFPAEADDWQERSVADRLDEMNGRLARIERAFIDLKMLILDQRRPPEE